MIHDSILGTIGNTPIVRINRLAPAGVDDVRQVRSLQSAVLGQGPARDRDHRGCRAHAARSSPARPWSRRRRATPASRSPMVCAVKGYPFVALMSGQFLGRAPQADARSSARRSSLTPAAERATGMVKKAEELAKKHGWFLARQFENPANPEYHRNTTGPEILRDFAGKRLDYWVTGWGTGGTLTGAGEMIKKARPASRSSPRSPRARRCFRRGMEAAQDPGLDAELDSGGAPHVSTRSRWDRRRSARHGARTRDEGGHLLRDLLGRHLCGGAQGRRQGAQGLRDPRDAAGHRRALFRRTPRSDEGADGE